VKIIMSPETVDTIKADLRRSLPNVASSHRIEATARGLGWATNAAMRAALVSGPVEREVQDDAFASYLSAHDFAVDRRVFIQAALRVQIGVVMIAYPQLTHFGFGVYGERCLSVEAWQAEVAKNRESMFSEGAICEFELACEYLLQLDTIKTPNRKHSSYGLKHEAERYHRRRRFAERKGEAYVSNGMLLTAAYHLGMKVVRVAWDSPNAFLNISSRSVSELASNRKPLPQPEPGQHFRVLGHNRGSFFYVPSGSKRVVALRAAAHTPAKLVQLAPLDYWTSHFPPRDRRSPFNSAAAMENLFFQARTAGIYEPPTPSRTSAS
jgi:hypothetical protein